MAGIAPAALVDKFNYALSNNWGYIYGKTHELWSASKQEAYNKAKAGDSDCENSIKYGKKWYGHWVTDCSGLFAWAFKELGGYIFHGSNTMFREYTTANGTLKSGRRTDGKELLPGTAVFVYKEAKKKYTHVGLYVGNGYVIEAATTLKGVIKTKVSDSKWTHWGTLKGVDYDMKPEPIPAGYAKVTGKRVALRSAPTTQASVIMRIDTGKDVKLEQPPPSEWDYVSYGGKKGYMMKKFMEEGK